MFSFTDCCGKLLIDSNGAAKTHPKIRYRLGEYEKISSNGEYGDYKNNRGNISYLSNSDGWKAILFKSFRTHKLCCNRF